MDITELALAYWRLSKWVAKAPVERKTAANNSLRQIKQYLADEGIETIDFTGQKYDCGLSIDVLENEAEPDCPECELVISETIRPTIIRNGNVIKYGQVIVGREEKRSPSNKKNERYSTLHTLIASIDAYRAADYSERKISNKLRQIKGKLSGQMERLLRKDGNNE